MKKTVLFNRIFILILCIGFAFTSCKKKEGCTDPQAPNYDSEAVTDDGSCEDPVATTQTPNNPTPEYVDADGIFVALKTVTYIETFGFVTETAIGIPVAFFPQANGEFKDVGDVTCEGEAVAKTDVNSYVFIPGATNPTGVDYVGGIDWTVSGANGFPALNYTSNGIFPDNVQIAAETNESISTSGDYTLSSVNIITNADSIIFAIYGPSATLLVTKATPITSYTFTADEMATLGTGAGYVQLTASRLAEEQTLGTGEKLYYLNQKTNTVVVTLN